MQGFGVTKYTNDLSNDLQVFELPMPVAGERDLVVENRAIATNPVDLKKLSGAFGGQVGEDIPDGPCIVGYDSSGVVTSVGSKVVNYKVGDEVYFAGALTRAGTFAQFTAVDERLVGAKPSSLSWAESASVPLTALTAYEALIEQLDLSVPEDVANSSHASKSFLVLPGGGGTGGFVTQIAKRVLGVGQVIATASRAETKQFCERNGADIVVNHREPLVPQLNGLGVTGVDYVFVARDLATQYWDDITSLLNPLGKIVSIVEPTGPVDIGKIMAKRGTLSFELMFTRSLFNVDMEKQRDVLNHVGSLIDSGVLRHNLTQEYNGVQGLRDAIALQKTGSAIGKIAVTL